MERLAITDRLDSRQGRGRPRDTYIRTESQKMGGSNGEGRRHHHGDGGQRNMATHGIQRPDRARNLTTSTNMSDQKCTRKYENVDNANEASLRP